MAYKPAKLARFSKPPFNLKGRKWRPYRYSKAIFLHDASSGDPHQRETSPPSHDETNDRRAIRQAIMTQFLREIADEIIAAEATVTSYDGKGNVTRKGNLKDLYDKDTKNQKFPMLRALIETPEEGFNGVRDRLCVARSFGSINRVVFRNAMALGDGRSAVDVEEVAKRVVIRAGMSGGYREKYPDSGFAGCK